MLRSTAIRALHSIKARKHDKATPSERSEEWPYKEVAGNRKSSNQELSDVYDKHSASATAIQEKADISQPAVRADVNIVERGNEATFLSKRMAYNPPLGLLEEIRIHENLAPGADRQTTYRQNSPTHDQYYSREQEQKVHLSEGHTKSKSPRLSTEELDSKPRSFSTSEDFDNISAILDPATYFAELDDIERVAIERCHLEEILEHPKSGKATARIDVDPIHIATYLNGVLHALAVMKSRGFCADSIVVLVEDAHRADVVRAESILIADIMRLHEVARRKVNGHEDSIDGLVSGLLSRFGLGLHVFRDDIQFGETGLNLLCCVVCLAVALYAGSNCMDLGDRMWVRTVDSIAFKGHSERGVFLRRRHLACLNTFIGGPVWVWGVCGSNTPCMLSAAIAQFADLWGPLNAIASSDGFESLLAIETEGGIMFQSEVQAEGDETKMHWISTTPFRKSMKSYGEAEGYMMTTPKRGE